MITSAALLALGLAASPLQAFAEPGVAAPEIDDAAEVAPGRARPAAPDRRTGHVLVAARGGYTGVGGSFAGGQPMSAVVTTSPEVGGAIGLGVGRSAVLELTGAYAKLLPAGGCSQVAGGSCSGSTYELGLGLVYHVAQGIAFDPWISYGAAFRSTSLHVSPSLKGTSILPGDTDSVGYKGIDVARFALGGDFYPIPSFGFGPYLEADFGTYLARPGPVTTGATYAFFGIGVRLTLDTVRLLSSPGAEKAGKTARR